MVIKNSKIYRISKISHSDMFCSCNLLIVYNMIPLVLDFLHTVYNCLLCKSNL